MLLPHLAELGYSAEVLAVDPVCCQEGRDHWQADRLPVEVPVHRVRGLSLAWAKLPGLGSLDARCHRALARAGSCLLLQRHFDAVYFSTTEFGCFRLGPLWQRHHGVPFLLDYQDPWVNDHYRLHPKITPPGGRLKYAMADRLHRFHEPRVLRYASGYTAVSAAYPAQLQARYPFAAAIPSLVLPFPGSEEDFQHLDSISSSQLTFDPHDGLIHWVCIGRADTSLFHLSLSGLFEAVACHAPAELRQRLRLHFLGTSYAPAGQGIPSIAPLAARFGLGEIVEERTDRLPLSLTLASLKAADALLVLGSNDPGYTASKLIPYLLARKPLLAILNSKSPGRELLMDCGGGTCVVFDESTPSNAIAQEIANVWIAKKQYSTTIPLSGDHVHPYKASAQARQLAYFIDQCLQRPDQ